MDLEKAKLNPAAVFKSPQEVVSNQELSREQKIEILRQWGQEAISMEVADWQNEPRYFYCPPPHSLFPREMPRPLSVRSIFA
jgi:hypothetical protein